MNEELQRLRDLLQSANDPAAVQFQIAKTYAAGRQYGEATHWLHTVVRSNLGFDPSRDRLFLPLGKTRELRALAKMVLQQTPPVSNSRLFVSIGRKNLFPENIAYNERTKEFFMGNTRVNEIFRCKEHKSCEPFGSVRLKLSGFVLGLKIDTRSQTLWATSNDSNAASLLRLDLESGALIQSYLLTGQHLFNDLAITSSGDVFVTDTKAGSVYQLSKTSGIFTKLAPQHEFTAANGVALSPDEKKLYVASFGDGISVVDLASQAVKALPHPSTVSLAYIDGLYATQRSLIAIQNGPMVPRIVRLDLSGTGREITAMTVLERRNSAFYGLTTGCLVGKKLYYIVNSQVDEVDAGQLKAGVTINPFRIFVLDAESVGRF